MSSPHKGTSDLHRLRRRTLSMLKESRGKSAMGEADCIIELQILRELMDAQERKKRPVATGVLDYFPDAIMEIALVSWTGNEQHSCGTPLHWDRAKSTDEADALMRHFIERGKRDTDGMRHSAKVAWRALALLQKEIESEGDEHYAGKS